MNLGKPMMKTVDDIKLEDAHVKCADCRSFESNEQKPEIGYGWCHRWNRGEWPRKRRLCHGFDADKKNEAASNGTFP